MRLSPAAGLRLRVDLEPVAHHGHAFDLLDDLLDDAALLLRLHFAVDEDRRPDRLDVDRSDLRGPLVLCESLLDRVR